MILYVLIILVLASFVFAFLSARTWHWGYVLLVEAIFLATLGFFLLAAETLRINGVLRSQVNKQQKELDELVANNAGLKEGTRDSKVLARLGNTDPPTKMPEDAESIASIEQLDHELLIATRQRGRIWRNVIPAGIDPKTGALKVTFTAPPRVVTPNPDAPEGGATPAAAPAPAPVVSGIKPDTVVFLFEEGPPQPPGPKGEPRGPQFLGEFTVAQAAQQQASLLPVHQMQPKDFETRRLAASRGPWVMYETMPADRYELYANMKEDQLKQLIPKQSINEYLRHGKEATADDEPWRKVGFDENGIPLPPDQIGKATKVLYQRRLRDYAAEFDELARRRVAMLADIDTVTKDIAQLKAAGVIAENLQKMRTEERQKLVADLAGITKEREAIEKHLAQVQQLLAKAQQLTAETLKHNRQLVAELAARQLRSRPANYGAGSSSKQPVPLALGK
jgi:hypothetical protein